MTQETTTPAVSYKETLNLPQTPFKMKAGAAEREPEIEAWWTEQGVYEQSLATRKNAGAARFVLHDGPPYLSSDKIHIGTALNKILKDIICRYKYQRGFYAPYVPGYDSHGLPIENAVVKTIKGGRHAVTPGELRKQCRAFALKNLDGQEANFKRLGVWGNWGDPYLTMKAEYEATQTKLFYQMFNDGHVYKGLKPVYWCPSCETALADAEVEYADHTSHSIYVKFPFHEETDDAGNIIKAFGVNISTQWTTLLKNASFVIWTTTPWTLPANLALAVNDEFRYSVIEVNNEKLVIAEKLLERFLADIGNPPSKTIGTLDGYQLEGFLAQHPFLDRKSVVLLGDHVTLDAGTGIVHTAPGHGMEDYLVVQEYNKDKAESERLPILSPLDDKGKFTEEAGVPALNGVFYEKGSEIVLDILKEKNALLGHSKYAHSYPHCWRCHNPVIYRATPQWFVNINGIRQPALEAIKKVEWIPARGEARIASMVEGRTDWCISRQRVWGVPIPLFTDTRTGEALSHPGLTEHLYEKFREHTTDIWWDASAEELLGDLPADVRTALAIEERLAAGALAKEMDIMDVWFDSGVSHTAVVEARADELGHLPVELYLEGSDQHRGWFQSSLLTSVMLHGKAPFKSVLTHGFVLDQDGRKMSKSLGNVVDPNSVIKQYGADVLRLWVASVDYGNDVRIGQQSIQQLTEVYKKVRNTIRFILGNLAGFNPATDTVANDQLSMLDQYILHRLQAMTAEITDAFDAYEFHRYFHLLQNFCVVDLSQLYFDVTKDILYCDATSGTRRRAVQTVLYELLKTLLPMLVPVMPHLAEDIGFSLPGEQKFYTGSVVLADWPVPNPAYQNEAIETAMDQLLALKETVNLTLEGPRKEGHIGSALEATITLSIREANHPLATQLAQLSAEELATLLLVSEVRLGEPLAATGWQASKPHADGSGATILTVTATGATGAKCERCWKLEPTVGNHAAHPSLCDRCSAAVSGS
ncbi:MAG: isoleucine--tRNA ligase [Candidatus Melainabacteria bacterium]